MMRDKQKGEKENEKEKDRGLYPQQSCSISRICMTPVGWAVREGRRNRKSIRVGGDREGGQTR